MKYFHFSELDSTNDWAKSYCRSDQSDTHFVVTCDQQRKGRGTNGREWYSQAGKQLLVTLAYARTPQRLDVHAVQALISSVIQEEVLQFYGLSLEKEWPNDLLLNNKKCAGILVESFVHQETQWLIIGLGLNVNTTCFPDALTHVATSFYLESGKEYDIQGFVQPLSLALCKGLDVL